MSTRTPADDAPPDDSPPDDRPPDDRHAKGLSAAAVRGQNEAGWVVAVDGGGSKIDLAALRIGERAIAEDKLLLENATRWNFQGCGSAHPDSWSKAKVNLQNCLQRVVEELGEPPLSVLFALAGAGRDEDRRRVFEWANALPWQRPVRINCVGDIEPIVDYGRGLDDQGQPDLSLAVILGTGSIVAARNRDHRLVRAGGWGPNLGDECSGMALGMAALKQVVRWLDSSSSGEIHFDADLALDGRSISPLVACVLERLKNASPRSWMDECAPAEDGSIRRDALASQLIQTAADRTLTATFANCIVEFGLHQGDQECMAVLEPQLESLAWQIEQVYHKVADARPPTKNEMPPQWRLVFTGGLAQDDCLRDAVVSQCGRRGLPIESTVWVVPVLAALKSALRLAVREW